jgi:hypothetical protein
LESAGLPDAEDDYTRWWAICKLKLSAPVRSGIRPNIQMRPGLTLALIPLNFWLCANDDDTL